MGARSFQSAAIYINGKHLADFAELSISTDVASPPRVPVGALKAGSR